MKNIEIRKVQEIKNKTLRIELAFKLSEESVIVIKGFRVGPSHNYGGLWVQPPSYHIFGKFSPMFFMENKDEWKQLEDDLIQMYQEKFPGEPIEKNHLNTESLAKFADEIDIDKVTI